MPAPVLHRFDLAALAERARAVNTVFALRCAAALDALATDGYYVLRAVVPGNVCDAALDEIEAFVRATGSPFSRTDRSTWNAAHKPVMHRNALMQAYGAGQCAGMWRLRTDPHVLALWRLLAGVDSDDELVSSMDGFVLGSADDAAAQRARADWSPDSMRRAGARLLNAERVPAGEVDALAARWQPNWAHVDQRVGDTPQPGPVALQSSIALLDAGDDDARFMCVPRSRHWIHAHAATALEKPGETWGKLKASGFARLLAAGHAAVPVDVRKGDVVLWCSDTVHYSCAARQAGLRAVAFVAMCPRAWLAQAQLDKRYCQLRAGKTSGAIAQLGTHPFNTLPQPRDLTNKRFAATVPDSYYAQCAARARDAGDADIDPDEDPFVPYRVRMLAGWRPHGGYAKAERLARARAEKSAATAKARAAAKLAAEAAPSASDDE